MESFTSGQSSVVEDETTGLSLVTLAPGLYGSHGFSPTRHNAPFTAISANARGQLYLIALPMMSGWGYRVDYPYYSWAETVVRPPVERRDFTELVERLNELERTSDGNAGSAQGRWTLDGEELASAVKFLDQTGTLCASALSPEEVARETRAALGETEEVWAART